MSVSVVAGALPGALVFYTLMPISSDVRFSGHAVVLPGVDVLWKQILSFKSSPHFANDTKRGFLNRSFLVVRRNNSFLATPLLDRVVFAVVAPIAYVSVAVGFAVGRQWLIGSPCGFHTRLRLLNTLNLIFDLPRAKHSRLLRTNISRQRHCISHLIY